jgi:hypothetical protein
MDKGVRDCISLVIDDRGWNGRKCHSIGHALLALLLPFILARVHPVQAEVWDFRCLDPIPGIRVFGCFAETDAFVALTWDYRENIEDASYWEEQVSRCREEWQKLFGGLAPHHAQELDEYVSYNFRAV